MDQKIDSSFQSDLFERFFQVEADYKQKETNSHVLKTESEKKILQALKQTNELAESKRQRENQDLERVRREIANALNIYPKAESGISEFKNPEKQLDMDYNPNEKLKEIKKELEKAASLFLLKTPDGNQSAYIIAQNARIVGGQILQKVSDYHQAKSEASEAIEKMRSKWTIFRYHENAKYIKSELSSLETEVNLVEKHFRADTISDYRQINHDPKQIIVKIGHFEALAKERRLKYRKKRRLIFGVSFWILFGVIGLPLFPFLINSYKDADAIISLIVSIFFWSIITIVIGIVVRNKNKNRKRY